MSVLNVQTVGAARTRIMPHPLNAGVVFGLDWMPIVGGDPESVGRQRARSLRSTHFLVMGEPGAVVGCGVLALGPGRVQSSRVARSRHLISAAAMFASAHALGVVGGIFHLTESGYWMVAVNAGRVLAQTDKWFVTLDEANTALVSLRTRFPNLQILATEDLLETALPDWVNEPVGERARLNKLYAAGRWSMRGGLSALMLGCGYMLWAYLSPAPAVPTQSVVGSDTKWQEVMARFASLHPVHRPAHLFQVLTAWHKTPLNPHGWKLSRILCESSHLDWHCAALYQRHRRFARSEQLDAVKPTGWSIDLIDMDQAVLRWHIVGAANLFESISPAIPLKEWLSYLQGVTPVFESIQIGSGTQIVFQAPLDEQGIAIERPSNIKSLKRRSISIKGPLRSMSALSGLTVPVRWRSVQLEVGPTGGHSISSSELMVHLLGEVFEIAE